MIITIYHPDGRMERRPIRYGGELCSQATAPYEKRDVPGSVKKQRTAEADEEPACTHVSEKLKAGR